MQMSVLQTNGFLQIITDKGGNMTRYEQIISLNKQEMVEFITDCTNMCEYCPCRLVCAEGEETGLTNTKCAMMLKWLDSEGTIYDCIMEVE